MADYTHRPAWSGLRLEAWEALQSLCTTVSSRPDALWAGIAEQRVAPRWIAFAGRDIDVPQEPVADQGFRELDGLPAGFFAAFLVPSKPRRAYACGFIEGVPLTLVVVPRPIGHDAVETIAHELAPMLQMLRGILPATGGGASLRPRGPRHASGLHDSDWLRIPTHAPAHAS